MKPLLLLLRHGHTDANEDNNFRGWSNPPLNEQGKGEAKEARKFLRKFPIDLVVHSPFDRTTETAKIVGVHKPLEIDDRLKPVNVGVFTGKSRDPKDKVVQIFDYYLQHRDRPIPKGESINGFEERYKPILEEGIQYGESGHLALFVAHTSNIIGAQNLLMGIDRNEEKGNLVKPGGVAGVFKTDKGYAVKALFRPETGREASDGTW